MPGRSRRSPGANSIGAVAVPLSMAAGLPRQRVYDIVTAAHELAANAVRHGVGHGRLSLWADSRSLRCQVGDDGQDTPAPGAA